MAFKCKIGMKHMKAGSLQDAARITARIWGTVATFRSEWRSLLKNLIAGNYSPVVTRGVLFGDPSTSSPSRGVKFITWPAIIIDKEGIRHWGMVQQVDCPQSHSLLQTWQLRDLLTIKHTPSSITVIAERDGAILWQNAASMATFGEC